MDKFQRTRGVLRLMASVIHSLWENGDPSLMIMPGTIPLHVATIHSEFIKYLESPWTSVMERDIDGPNALSLRLDRDTPNLGRYSACRRVARTIFMASAPLTKASNRGIDDRHIRLGCVQPGENAASFGDALRRLSDQAIYLYMDKSSYWFSTQPTVLSLAKDRAAQLKKETVMMEIEARLKKEQKKCGDFARVHACPANSADVADETSTRLVILGPEFPYIRNQTRSPAHEKAEEILETRGQSPRQYRNTLAFLAPDHTALENLMDAVRDFLAWQSIEHDKGEDHLNLDAYQCSQVEKKKADADGIIEKRMQETFCYILIPYQDDPKSDTWEWSVTKSRNDEGFAKGASDRLKREELFLTQMAGTHLKVEMDRIPLWRGDHVSIEQLKEDFARYLYLPALKSPDVLVDAIKNGISLESFQMDSFAYADRFDEKENRYAGLKTGSDSTVSVHEKGLVVKGDVAIAQMESDGKKRADQTDFGGRADGKEALAMTEYRAHVPDESETDEQPAKKATRFFGACSLDPDRMAKDISTIADEIIQHLNSLVGVKLNISLEIDAELPEGAPEEVVRTIKENTRTLQFRQAEFDEEKPV